MKKKYLFCTKVWFYLTEIPFIILLIISIINHKNVDTLVGLIPLIVLCSAGIVFTFLFFFRLVVISTEELRSRGLFSSRDSAVVNKDKTLILTMLRGSNLRVELYGNDGKPPILEGMKDEPPMDIFLYRDKAIAGPRTVASILRYFGVPNDDANEAANTEAAFSKEYDDISLSSEKREDIREIRIKFKETI